MIEPGSGNLLTAEADALVNTVNTVGVMGKGIALQFKRAYPDNFKAYQAACKRGDIQLGRVFVFDTGVMGSGRYILNFPTKKHWRGGSRLEDIRSGLTDLVRVAGDLGVESIAVPALGCGNGGLAWSQVRPLIEEAASRIPAVKVIVFAPAGAPPAESMPNATEKPRLTPRRALLVTAIGRYLGRARAQEARDGVSELEIQKLAYFLQAFGAPLQLRFVRGTYGPYADNLGHVLSDLEGHYLAGYGDRSAKVTDLAPINPTPGSLEEAVAVIEPHDEYVDYLARLLDLVDGFETPYNLELLATVLFAANQEPPTADVPDLAARVAAWSLRKARLFTEQHVRIAAERLTQQQLLPVA